jgi:hypothetical protein
MRAGDRCSRSRTDSVRFTSSCRCVAPRLGGDRPASRQMNQARTSALLGGAWMRGSNPAPAGFAVQGRRGEDRVTCDVRMPAVTARARRGPAVSECRADPARTRGVIPAASSGGTLDPRCGLRMQGSGCDHRPLLSVADAADRTAGEDAAARTLAEWHQFSRRAGPVLSDPALRPRARRARGSGWSRSCRCGRP